MILPGFFSFGGGVYKRSYSNMHSSATCVRCVIGSLSVRSVSLRRLLRAALNAAKDPFGQTGSAPEKYIWGKVHRIEYLNPIRQKGIGKGVLGGSSHPVGGSCETLRRNIYDFKRPFDVIKSASLRIVADLDDPEKVLAVLPGGVSGRTFHPHAKDQADRFIKGEKVYRWFSDAAIRDHAETTPLLKP